MEAEYKNKLIQVANYLESQPEEENRTIRGTGNSNAAMAQSIWALLGKSTFGSNSEKRHPLDDKYGR